MTMPTDNELLQTGIAALQRAQQLLDGWKQRMWSTVYEREAWLHDIGEHDADTDNDLPYAYCPRCEIEKPKGRLATVTAERDMVSEAIVKIARAAGMIEADMPMTGPQLLLVAEELEHTFHRWRHITSIRLPGDHPSAKVPWVSYEDGVTEVHGTVSDTDTPFTVPPGYRPTVVGDLDDPRTDPIGMVITSGGIRWSPYHPGRVDYLDDDDTPASSHFCTSPPVPQYTPDQAVPMPPVSEPDHPFGKIISSTAIPEGFVWIVDHALTEPEPERQAWREAVAGYYGIKMAGDDDTPTTIPVGIYQGMTISGVIPADDDGTITEAWQQWAERNSPSLGSIIKTTPNPKDTSSGVSDHKETSVMAEATDIRSVRIATTEDITGEDHRVYIAAASSHDTDGPTTSNGMHVDNGTYLHRDDIATYMERQAEAIEVPNGSTDAMSAMTVSRILHNIATDIRTRGC